MDSFFFSQYDVIFISVSINACFLLQMLTSRLVKWLVPFFSPRSSICRNLLIVHQRWPDLLGRTFSEQITLFVLFVLILVNLSIASSPLLPFREHHSSEYHQLTRLILSASTARFFLIALNVLLATDSVPFCNNEGDFTSMTIRASSGHTKSAAWHFAYCTFSITSNIIGMGYKQNLLLLGTSSFMELNTTSLVIHRLIKFADRHRGCQSYFKMSILCCGVCLFSRLLLPGIFLCLAVSQESPFVMDVVPLTWFCICACVYFLFHVVLVYHSIRRIIKAYRFLSESVPRSCHHTFPGNGAFSIYPNSDRLTNDIYGESLLLDSEKQSLGDDCPPKHTTNLKDLNYGFLPCYDNRNLCSSVFESEGEKINFLQKKNSSKHEFIYKFMSKGNSVSNNGDPPYLCYSRGVEAGSLTKGCENTDSVNSTSPPCDNHQNYNSSNPNNLRTKELFSEIKQTDENIGFCKDIALENRHSEFKLDDDKDNDDDDDNVFDVLNDNMTQGTVDNNVILCHRLPPNPDVGALPLPISEEGNSDSSDTECITLDSRHVARLIPNEIFNVDCCTTSFNNVVPVITRYDNVITRYDNVITRYDNHPDAAAQCQTQSGSCDGEPFDIVKNYSIPVTEDSHELTSKQCETPEKLDLDKSSLTHSQNDLNFLEFSPP